MSDKTDELEITGETGSSIDRTFRMTNVGDPFDLDDLRETGVLWAINRIVFHPRGFALALTYPDGTTPQQVADGAEPDGWTQIGGIHPDGVAVLRTELGATRIITAKVLP
ncbi:MAG: hypothetical protein AAGA90_23275 [Actinomycetota bacterium]